MSMHRTVVCAVARLGATHYPHRYAYSQASRGMHPAASSAWVLAHIAAVGAVIGLPTEMILISTFRNRFFNKWAARQAHLTASCVAKVAGDADGNVQTAVWGAREAGSAVKTVPAEPVSKLTQMRPEEMTVASPVKARARGGNERFARIPPSSSVPERGTARAWDREGTAMQVVYTHCCGLDVHQKTVVACVLLTQASGQVTREVRVCGTMTADLLALNEWLNGRGVGRVAREVRRGLWRPVYNRLEADHDVILVHAQHLKAVPGRRRIARTRNGWPTRHAPRTAQGQLHSARTRAGVARTHPLPCDAGG
jgi:hypothetical protein